MPTGYTAKLVESGQTFEEFALTCARAFGACIEFRDERLDLPLPEKFAPSPYHAAELRKAKAKLTRLKAYTADQRRAYGEKQRKDEINGHVRFIRKQNEENARVNAMIASVNEWEPPTPEHVEMKTFMLDQLDMSLYESEYSQRALKAAQERAPVEYYKAALREAERDIEYHEEHIQKETERAAGTTTWLQKLRASLRTGNVQPQLARRKR